MPLASDIYDRLADQLGAAVAQIFDTKLPDGYRVGATPIIVYRRLGSAPTRTLAGTIAMQRTLVQVSVQCSEAGLTAGRAVREQVVDALNNYRSSFIQATWFEADLGELPPSLEVPAYQIPIDFTFLHPQAH